MSPRAHLTFPRACTIYLLTNHVTPLCAATIILVITHRRLQNTCLSRNEPSQGLRAMLVVAGEGSHHINC